MKKSIHINQRIAMQFDLSADEAIVFDWIFHNRNDQRYWLVVGKNFIKMPAKEAALGIPMISKIPETIRKIYRRLELKGIIEYYSPFHHRDDYIWIVEEALDWDKDE
jgi:hypothetical protein